ncbi:MAG: DUF4214 domain-containing protein [Leptospirales bacterium]|nr:DUF4214 domain-containing protein [Leptospirales bacterium]
MPPDLTQLREQIELEAARLRGLPAGTEVVENKAGLPRQDLARAFEEELVFEPSIDSSDSPVCDVRAILRFDGHDFIRNCYRQILRREADGDGLSYYYDLLKRGKKKFEIVLRMRASREGRIARIRLVRWFWPGLYFVVVSIPLIGYVAEVLIETLLWPRTLTKLVLRQELLREKLNRLLQK